MKRHASPLLQSRSLRSSLVLGAPLALLVAGALPACADTEPRDLGFTQSTQDLTNIPDEPFFEDATQLLGRWEGTAVDTLALTSDGSSATYAFPSGSTRIVVELQVAADEGLTGTLTLGEAEPLAPATDPDVGYPEGVGYDALLGYEEGRYPIEDGSQFINFIRTNSTIPPFEGFSYQLHGWSTLIDFDNTVKLPDGVASLAFNTFEPIAGWCELQTSYPHEGGGHLCIPDLGGQLEVGSDGSGKLCGLYGPPILSSCETDLSNLDECYDPGEPVAYEDCDKVAMCINNVCTCDAAGCVASDAGDRLTLRLIGDELVGLFEKTVFKNARGLSTPVGEVRLHRVQ